jgi:hypothetical protein
MFALAFSVTPVLAKSPGGGPDLTCAGGSISAGTYDSITVTGFCMVDAGSITVRHDLVVKEGAALVAAFGGSNVTVKGDLRVEKNAMLGLGCVPTSFACLDDPTPFAPTYSATARVGHDLTADDALVVIVHNTWIGHDVNQHGGGGGIDCVDMVVLGLAPAYSTYEDSTIGGSVSITGLRTCWLGFLNNTVGNNVNFNDNRTWNATTGAGDRDGNEVAANTIGGDLDCARNNPAPQVGDSGLPLNVVGGDATGQCRKLSTRGRH